MTIKEISSLIGKEMLINLDGLDVKVQVTDAKTAFGRMDAYIQTDLNKPGKWIMADRLRPIS